MKNMPQGITIIYIIILLYFKLETDIIVIIILYRYYSVVRKPMDLSTMEEKLENSLYKSLSEFKRDFRLIVDNCRQYNGSDNG